MPKNLKIAVLSLFLVLLGYAALGQVKGESGIKWYSWHASGGFMLPVDPFNAELSVGTEHNYRFSGIPGFTFSLAKPITVRVIIGGELQDIIADGKLTNKTNPVNNPLYNTRMRSYNLFFQYYLFPNTNINHFVMAKAGRSRLNVGLEGAWDPTESVPGNDTWEWLYSIDYGVTWHANPNFSVNLYGEFSTLPNNLGDIYSPEVAAGRSNLPMGRIVLSLTGHTDIRVFFPFSKARKYTSLYKPDTYLPFYYARKRKK